MSKKILIVEDDESLLKLETIVLTNKGYTVAAVDTGSAACEAVETDPPSLVLLDAILPGIDGFEVCKRIKTAKATRHIPVVMLSAKTNQEDMAKGIAAGADAYFTKPFKTSQVLASVESYLQSEAIH